MISGEVVNLHSNRQGGQPWRLESDFLQSSAIFLTAAVVAVPLAQRLRIRIVSWVTYLAGVAIGPWGLGLIRDVEAILTFCRVWCGAAAVSDWA